MILDDVSVTSSESFAADGFLPTSGLTVFEGDGEKSSSQNDANNPLTPKVTLNLHDYYVPSLIGVPDREANQLLFRGLMPFKVLGVPQLFRFTLPVVTSPTFPNGSDTGFGDLTIFDLIPFASKPVELAAGPLFVAPLGDNPVLGSGKWQAGAAGLALLTPDWGILGGLTTYQHSFSGSDQRDDVSLLTVQPLLFYNLPSGFYLRSSGIWNFDLENHRWFIPVGFGVGHVTEISDTVTMNVFVEPQYSVLHDDDADGFPRWQIFAGINFQIAMTASTHKNTGPK